MELVRCKACGLILPEKKLGDVCPACGVPRSAFEPYRETMSGKRKFILNLNLHPIALHFPQAFSAIIPPFIIMGVAVNPIAGHDLLATVKVASLFMPLAVAAAFVCGLIDGKTRFKKFNTPYLILKIMFASVLLALSVILAAVAYFYGTDYPGRLFLLILSLACIACQIYLAGIGKMLMNAKLPG